MTADRKGRVTTRASTTARCPSRQFVNASARLLEALPAEAIMMQAMAIPLQPAQVLIEQEETCEGGKHRIETQQHAQRPRRNSGHGHHFKRVR